MRKLALLLTLFFVTAITAFAGTGGNEKKGEPSVAGTVVDLGSKKPLADVTITAIHSTTKTEHVLVTDANGNFKLPQLAVGTYKFKFEKDSYKTVEKNNVVVKQDNTSKLNIELLNYKDEEPEDSRNWSLKFGY